MLMLQIDKVEALAALEIGGSNGMINVCVPCAMTDNQLLTGAKSIMDLPIVDGDFMVSYSGSDQG